MMVSVLLCCYLSLDLCLTGTGEQVEPTEVFRRYPGGMFWDVCLSSDFCQTVAVPVVADFADPADLPGSAQQAEPVAVAVVV